MAELQSNQLSCRTQQKSMTREGEQTFRHARGSIYKISCQLLRNIGLAVKRPTWWAPTALRTWRWDLNSNLTIRGLIFPAHILEDFTSHQFQIASRAYLENQLGRVSVKLKAVHII